MEFSQYNPHYSLICCYTMPQVTFLKRWGERSWLVEHNAPFYDNARQPHVEVINDEGVYEGAVHEIVNCRVMETIRKDGSIKKGKAILWDVVGRTNRGRQAHFTVGYYDSPEKATARFNEMKECYGSS